MLLTEPSKDHFKNGDWEDHGNAKHTPTNKAGADNSKQQDLSLQQGVVPSKLKLKASSSIRNSNGSKVAKPVLGRGSYSKPPKKVPSPKNSIIEEVQNSTTDKRSGLTQRPSLFSVNTDLIFEGTMSEAEMIPKDTLKPIGSIKSIEESQKAFIKQIYKIDTNYISDQKRNSQTHTKW